MFTQTEIIWDTAPSEAKRVNPNEYETKMQQRSSILKTLKMNTKGAAGSESEVIGAKNALIYDCNGPVILKRFLEKSHVMEHFARHQGNHSGKFTNA